MSKPSHGHHAPHVRRTETGVIDMEYYKHSAHQLRAQAIQEWFDQVSGAVGHGWRWLRDRMRSDAHVVDDATRKDLGIGAADSYAIASGLIANDATRRQRGAPGSGPAPDSNAVCWLNGMLYPIHQARVSVLDHGLLYGDGVFEGIRFYRGRAFLLREHLARLFRSATALRLTIPYDHDALAHAVQETIDAFAQPDGYLRLVVTRGEGKLGIDPASCVRANVFIVADALAMVSTKAREQGARLIIAATRRLPADGLDPRIKSLNYLNHILARMEAANASADEAILLNAQGRVAEGTADNVFIVRDGVLLTPPVIDGALEGITRGVVLELAARERIRTRETSLAPYDLYTADECFLTGTGAELIPVREIDGRALRHCPGPIYRRLQRAFHHATVKDAA